MGALRERAADNGTPNWRNFEAALHALGNAIAQAGLNLDALEWLAPGPA